MPGPLNDEEGQPARCLVYHVSMSSFGFSSELTPPERREELIISKESALDDRVIDPLFAALGQFRVMQYKEELESLVVMALNSEGDAYGGVISSESSHPLILTAALLLLSLACFLPMATKDVFADANLREAVNSNDFRQALFLAIGCGLPKLLDLLSLLTERSLTGASGCNVVLSLMCLCFTLPNLILLLLPQDCETLFVCTLQWQIAVIAVFTMGFFTSNLAAQTDFLIMSALAFMVVAYSICAAFAFTRATELRKYQPVWWITLWVQILRILALLLYLNLVKTFVLRLWAHKKAVGEGKLMHINFHFGVLLHCIIIFTLASQTWPFFLRLFYNVDYTKEMCTNIVYLRAAAVVALTYAHFHLARMEKARVRQLLRERIEASALSWLQA